MEAFSADELVTFQRWMVTSRLKRRKKQTTAGTRRRKARKERRRKRRKRRRKERTKTTIMAPRSASIARAVFSDPETVTKSTY